MAPTFFHATGWAGAISLVAIVGLLGWALSDFLSRPPRFRPHVDDLPAPRDLDEHEDAIRGDRR